MTQKDDEYTFTYDSPHGIIKFSGTIKTIAFTVVDQYMNNTDFLDPKVLPFALSIDENKNITVGVFFDTIEPPPSPEFYQELHEQVERFLKLKAFW